VEDQFSAKASTYTGQHNTEKHRNTSMPRTGFETTIPMFERPKTVLALDCTASETGNYTNTSGVKKKILAQNDTIRLSFLLKYRN
jgi:hypothetical protein